MRGKFIGMGFALEFFPTRIDSDTVLCKLLRQAKQLKVIGLQVHTRNDSPQPHLSRSLGLLKRKPSFKPSRTKSNWVPSI